MGGSASSRASSVLDEWPTWANDLPRGTGSNRGETSLSRRELAMLRYAAGTMFVTDYLGATVQDMRELRQFSAVSMRTMQRWAQEDQWLARRHHNLSLWHRLIEQRLGDWLTNDAVQRLRGLERLMTRLEELMGPGAVQTLRSSTWEGICAALVKVVRTTFQLREQLHQRLAPGHAPNQPVASEQAKLTTSELGLIAEALTARRAGSDKESE